MRNRPKQIVTRNYFNRREQRRLLILVMSLGLVVVLMSKAVNLKNWEWFSGEETAAVQVNDSGPVPDTRVKEPSQKPLPPGVIRISSQETAEDEAETTGAYFQGVKPELLELVEDDTPKREREKAWGNLIQVLNKTPYDQLVKASTGRVQYPELSSEPEAYRGKLITIGGEVHRVRKVRAKSNTRGIKNYYEVWLQPSKKIQKPVLVYCLELPNDFPEGEEIREPVELTGFFLKRWSYRTPNNQEHQTAPLLLAKTFSWKSARAIASENDVQEPAEDYFEGVQPKFLQLVKDNTHLLKDSKAWYHLMKILDKTENDQLVKASIGRVGYLQLYNQPEVYRGKLVTITGTIQRAYYYLDKNKNSGIEGHYQIFLRPESNIPSPIVIYCLNLPEGFPTGDNLNQEAQLTGFFFKRWPYNAKDTTRLAPLMLAKTFSWKKAPVRSSFNPSVWNLVILFVGTLVFAFVVAITVFKQSQLITLPGHDGVRPTAPPDALSALNDEEILPNVKEQLEQIATQDQTPP